MSGLTLGKICSLKLELRVTWCFAVVSIPVEPILIKKLLRGDGECSVTSLRALLRVFSASLTAVLLVGGGDTESDALRPSRHGDLLRADPPLLTGGDGVAFRASLESTRRRNSNFRPIRRPHVDSTGKQKEFLNVYK